MDPLRNWVAFDLDAAKIALEHWQKPADRGGWFLGFHTAASGGILWPRASVAEQSGFHAGEIALWDSQAKKKATSEANRARIMKRWTNRKPPEETPSNDP